MAFSVSAELRDWVQPGRAGVIAVADGEAVEIVRFWALRFLDGPVLEAYVQRSAAEKALAIIGSGARAAFNAIELPSYRSRSFKGFCAPSKRDIDEAFVAASASAYQRVFMGVGMSEDAVSRMTSHADSPELVGLLLTVDAVYDQSPKPGAGMAL